MTKSENKILLAEAEEKADSLREYFSDVCEQVVVCGSVRRKAKTVADIDLVVLAPKKDLTNTIILNIHKTSLAGFRKISFTYFDIQVDIMIAYDPQEFAPMILHCTGGKWSNIKMRRRAKEMGLKLNEYGLWKGGGRLPCKTEKDIYKHLGLEYIEPKNRN